MRLRTDECIHNFTVLSILHEAFNPPPKPNKKKTNSRQETDKYIYEVKTSNWWVPGTAGEKVLGTFVKYQDIPEGIKEYVEDFDFFRKTIRLAKDTVKPRDKVLVTPHVKINNFKDRIINTLPDEIVFKTMPDNGELFEERNNVLVKDKNIIFYETKKLIDESKSIFNLKQ
jgi:hypothetical protein